MRRLIVSLAILVALPNATGIASPLTKQERRQLVHITRMPKTRIEPDGEGHAIAIGEKGMGRRRVVRRLATQAVPSVITEVGDRQRVARSSPRVVHEFEIKAPNQLPRLLARLVKNGLLNVQARPGDLVQYVTSNDSDKLQILVQRRSGPGDDEVSTLADVEVPLRRADRPETMRRVVRPAVLPW